MPIILSIRVNFVISRLLTSTRWCCCQNDRLNTAVKPNTKDIQWLRTKVLEGVIHKSKPVISEVQEKNNQDDFCIAGQILFKDVQVPPWG